MAWLPTDKDKLCHWLGLTITAANLAAVQNKMDSLQALSEDAVTRVQSYITTLESIDGQISTNRSSPNAPLAQLAAQGRRYVQNLAATIGLDVQRDVF